MMLNQESNVLILKPTPVFVSFLKAALPELSLSHCSDLKTDHTAYTFFKQESDEATLEEIERHFPKMFQHEIRRLVGNDVDAVVDVSFLDFLCCFKFELHSQIVLMESSIQDGQHLLCVKPRTGLLSWIKSAAKNKHDWMDAHTTFNLTDLTANATVLVKNFTHEAQVGEFVQHYYRPLFKAEMLRLCSTEQDWPEVTSFQAFNRYFAVQYHTQVIHLH